MMPRMHKHNFSLTKIQLAISILGQFDFNGLLRVLGHQFDPHSRPGGENILHSGLKLIGIRPKSIEFQVMRTNERDFVLIYHVC